MAENRDEARLLARLRDGEDKAYEELVRFYSPRLLAVARRFLRSEDDARDAVQDAFVSAFRGIGSFEGGSRLSTWLHRIVVNAALMRLRTRRRKPEESIEDMLPSFLDDGHMSQPTPSWLDSAENLMEADENRTTVRAAIARLPEKYRSVLLLRDIEDYDTDETAKALGLSRAAVKTRLHRARQALRTQLESSFRADNR